MKIISVPLLILYIFSSVQIIFAQEIKIKGKVRHANTYQTISGVNVYVKNSNIGTTSNNDGYFSIQILSLQENRTIVFEHISYYKLELSIEEAKEQKYFNLQPRIIQLPEVGIEAEKDLPKILLDLPQPHSIIEGRNIEIQGFVDAGDLLKVEQSVQVKENLSGKKTISIRGGNPDDVLVLYNGIKMNSVYDNIFDLSLINIEDIKRFEIIKGSHSTLYGSEAISGVINIVPKIQRDYTLKFQQKLGTYSSGDWNLQFNRNLFNKFNLSYSYKQGSTTREYLDSVQGNELLVNESSYHTASIFYDLSGKNNLQEDKNISLMYFRSDLNYQNSRNDEKVMNLNQMITANYSGNLLMINNFNVTGAYQWYDNDQFLSAQSLQYDQNFANRTVNFNVINSQNLKNVGIILSYQFENNQLDYKNHRIAEEEPLIGVESALYSNFRNSFSSIVKMHMPTESNFLTKADVDFSYRFDDVQNSYDNLGFRSSDSLSQNNEFSDKNWRKSMLKFSAQLSGGNEKFQMNAFLNYGTNYKFPTMFQQISMPQSIGNPANQPYILPEKNKSLELGIDLIGETLQNSKVNGWQLSTNFFVTNFFNKIRTFYEPEIPIAFYDNVQNAKISGLEVKGSLYFFQNKLMAELGSSIYSISEKAAFPFNSEMKHILNVSFNHMGYSFQFHWVREGEQVGWVKGLDGTFEELGLPGYTNFDVHLNKKFEFKRIHFYANFSGRNLLDDDTLYNGIAIRDRRFYFTFGTYL